MPSYSINDIRAAVSRNAFEKGTAYSRNGNVVQCAEKNEGELITAITRGTERTPYRQEIRVYALPSGRAEFEGQCTCPMSFNCKHVAAALLVALAQHPDRGANAANGAGEESGPSLPPQVNAWLVSLENAARKTEGEDRFKQDDLAIYVLNADRESRGGLPLLLISPQHVRLRKDGSVAPNVVHIEPSTTIRNQAAKYLRPADFRILRRLERHNWSYDYTVPDEEGPDTLARILATGRARWADKNGPALTEGPERPAKVVWRVNANGTQSPHLDLEQGIVPLRMTPPWYVDTAAGKIGPLELDLAPPMVLALLASPEIPAAMAGQVRAEIERTVGAHIPAPAPLPKAKTLRVKPVPHVKLLRGHLPADNTHRALRDGALVPAGVAELSFEYGPVRVESHARESKIRSVHEGVLYEVARDRTAESGVLERLQQLSIKPVSKVFGWNAPDDHELHFVLDRQGGDGAWADLLYRDAPALRAEGWKIDIAEDFPLRLAQVDGDIEAELTEGSGIDWFDLALGASVDGVHFDLVPVLLDFLSRKGNSVAAQDDAMFVQLEDGRWLALPAAKIQPILDALAALFRGRTVDGESVRFSLMDAADLAALEEATAKAGLRWTGGEALRALGRKLRDVGSVPKAKLPRKFKAKLRPYQQRGVDWLQFLRDVGFGGVLADDMGLGKTVQTLAHLSIEKDSGRMDRPALIVCPTSLVANWRQEAQRFAPHLSVLALHGAERKANFDAIAEQDIVITTYPLLARDHEVLTAQPWHTAILDEAQMIKNPDALTAKLAGQLDARQRLCLSGTPLENHLGELWSLFSFAAPGFLGDRTAFKRRYRTPIEKLNDEAKRAALAARVKPFILRRTKDQVLKDLPPKTDIAEAVELHEGQRALYEAVRLAMQKRVRDAIAKTGLARSQIMILDALLKMRQACCDPRLVKLDTPARKKAGVAAGSAKLDRLMEMIPAMREEGRRILLFSQFTSMLALIEEELRAANVPYVQLTGDTRDHETPVRQFQSGQTDVFLISLKAGGQGLNLTAADTIILYDPWWNPAVEDQAAGRAHRIGQTKPVFVHRLTAIGTIEEKMEELKARKRELVAGILDGALGTKLVLSESDVEALFAA